jgi:hypothetical protein
MTGIRDKPWNLYEITSPTRDIKSYWFDQASKPRNGTFRSKIRVKYLNCLKKGTLHLEDPVFLYGDQVNVSVRYFDSLPKTMTINEVKELCRKLTSVNERLHEETGEIITFSSAKCV